MASFKQLSWFQQNFPQNGEVRYNIVTKRDGLSDIGDDYTCMESDLQAIAAAHGRTTWDETDIVTYHGNKFSEPVTIPIQPKREEPSNGQQETVAQ